MSYRLEGNGVTLHVEEEYDPLEDGYLDEEEPDSDGAPPVSGQLPFLSAKTGEGDYDHAPCDTVDNRPPYERLQDLFSHMRGQEPVLYGVLRFCALPCRVADVNEEIERLKKHHRSVYAPADVTALLERAGGIIRTFEDGSPYDDEAAAQGRCVVVDGVEYLEPIEAPHTYWLTTQEGAAFAAQDDPEFRLRSLMEKDAIYAPIYQRVLACCAQEGGAQRMELTAIVDDDPLVKKPLRTAPYFTNGLASCGAVEWQGAWRITDLGRSLLERLRDGSGTVDAIE